MLRLSLLTWLLLSLAGSSFPAPSSAPASQPAVSIDGHFHRTCIDAACHPIQNAGRIPTHSPYLEGQCLACHVDHQSTGTALLRAGGDSLCLACHQGLEFQAGGQRLAHPPDSPSCLTCHEPHQSRAPAFTRGSQPLAQCVQCHEPFLTQAERLPYRHLYFDPRGQCADCHYAHRGKEQKYLRENVAQSCLTCHDVAIQLDNRRLEDLAERLRDAPVVHGALRLPDSCPHCHTPHGSAQPSLLKPGYPTGAYETYQTADYALCWQCHSKNLVESVRGTGATEFRDGDVNLHHLHVAQLRQGRACHLCHAAHDSNVKDLLREQVRFGQWNAPLRHEALADGGRCQTPCHREQEYHRLKQAS